MSSKLINALWAGVMNLRTAVTKVSTIKSVRLRIILAVPCIPSSLCELSCELCNAPMAEVSARIGWLTSAPESPALKWSGRWGLLVATLKSSVSCLKSCRDDN